MSFNLISALPSFSNFLIAYSSYLAAFMLAGQNKKKSAGWVLIPAFTALGAFLLPWQTLAYAAAIISVFGGFLVLLRLSERNVVLSLTGA